MTHPIFHIYNTPSAALHLKNPEPELVERGYNHFDNGAFLAVSSFNNAGFSLSSQSVNYLHDNPCAYLVLSVRVHDNIYI